MITLFLEGDVDSFDDSREHRLKIVLAGLLSQEVCSGPLSIRIEKPALSSKTKAKIGTGRCCIRVEVDESQLPQHTLISRDDQLDPLAELSDDQLDIDIEQSISELTKTRAWPSNIGVEDISVVFRRFSQPSRSEPQRNKRPRVDPNQAQAQTQGR